MRFSGRLRVMPKSYDVPARALAATAVAVAILTTGACSSETTIEGRQGDPSTLTRPASATGSSVEEYLALKQKLADCYRQNGLKNAQDPDELGGIGGLTFGDPALESALTACKPISQQVAKLGMPAEIKQELLDQEAARMTPAEKKLEVEFAKCMQNNGFPDYPDPQPNGLASTPDWAKPGATTPPPAGIERAAQACNTKLGFGPPAGAPTN